jgi:hypothetical protein
MGFSAVCLVLQCVDRLDLIYLAQNHAHVLARVREKPREVDNHYMREVI